MLSEFGVAVVPRTDCPHVSEEFINFNPDAYPTSFVMPCSDCDHIGENWVCLQCQTVKCSRYVNEDMLSHYNADHHPIAVSFSDLSFWCFECDSYIKNRELNNLYNFYSHHKFGSAYVDRKEENLKEFEASKNAMVVGSMYAVEPKRNCPHVVDSVNPDYSLFERIHINQQCEDCTECSENWVCLACGTLKCSRYVNEHMLFHAIETSHPICLSLSDLSFWCYPCESYIVSGRLRRIYEIFSTKKFGEPRTNTTAHKTEEEKKEYFDSPQELSQKLDILAQWVRESAYMLAFTGAGISTSAGIPDYRSGFGTVLETGPGIWERKALAGHVNRPGRQVDLLQAIPTPTHMSFVKLAQEGFLKSLVSQNVDGMHRKSGVPPFMLAELHGNTNLEKCKQCRKEYMRDYETRTNPHVHYHETGRKCDDPDCRGDLCDTIINFGENLDTEVISKGFSDAERADLCIAMGSSLRVTPAAHIPKAVGKKDNGRLVIVNLQSTPLDSYAGLRIFAKCDDVMVGLMQRLGLTIPEFRLERRVGFRKRRSRNPAGVKENSLIVQGFDVDNSPFSLFPKVQVQLGDTLLTAKHEPLQMWGAFGGEFEVKLFFLGNYGESDLVIRLNWDQLSREYLKFQLIFNPMTGIWESITPIS